MYSSIDQSEIFGNSPSIRHNKSKHINRLANSTLINQSTNNELSFSQKIKTDDLEEENDDLIENNLVLFKQFFEAKQKNDCLENVFDLLNEYENLCSDYLIVMTNLKKNNISLIQGVDFSEKFQLTLKYELNTWRLIRVLYEDRLKDDNMEDLSQIEVNKRFSDRKVIEKFYETNSTIRQMQLVVDWLELNEQDVLEKEHINEKIQFFSEKCAYENTLHVLKTKKDKIIKNFNKQEFNFKSDYLDNVCTSLDPDAPFRENKEFVDLDREDENRLMKYIFKFLRAGMLDVGKKLAEDFGHHWLSACLDGWLLQNDSFADEEEVINNKSQSTIEGNSNRDLWKLTCWNVSKTKNNKISIYEKAIFGALSGNVKDVLPLCTKWEDRLWIYFRSSIDAQIELELRKSILPKQFASRISGIIENDARFCTDLPVEYFDNLLTCQEIFKEIESKKKNEEVFVGEKCYQKIIKYVILNDLDTVFEVMIEWIRNKPTSHYIYTNILRFCAHFVLFCKSINLINNDTRQNLCITILESYIDYLIDLKQIQLIAFYVSHLPNNYQIVTYSKLLTQIRDKKKRELCIKYGKDFKLDIDMITKTVVENIRVEGVEETDFDFSNIEKSVKKSITILSEEDIRKIDSLDWLFFNHIQYIELLLQANALIRYFVLRDKVEAGKTVFLKLPVDIIDGVYKEWKKINNKNDLPPEIQDNAKEYLCFKSFFTAHEEIQNWFKFYYNAKPEEPIEKNSSKFSDKVAYSYAIKNYQSEFLHWKHLLIKQANTTSKMIYEVLIFANSGEWMTNHDQLDEEQRINDEKRLHELKNLRKIVIPQLTFSLYSILHMSSMYQECFELLNVIASEKYNLYEEFSKKQLKDLMKKCRETSLI